jgi:hypothetical protein
LQKLLSRKLVKMIAVIIVLALSLTWLSCSQQTSVVSAPISGASKATITLEPPVVKTTDRSMIIKGSGFEPSKTVTIAIVGIYKNIENPPIGAALANQNGEVKIDTAATAVWQGSGGLAVQPGEYTLVATQKDNNISAKVPFVLTK